MLAHAYCALILTLAKLICTLLVLLVLPAVLLMYKIGAVHCIQRPASVYGVGLCRHVRVVTFARCGVSSIVGRPGLRSTVLNARPGFPDVPGGRSGAAAGGESSRW